MGFLERCIIRYPLFLSSYISIFVASTSSLHHLPGPWYTHFTHLRLKRAVVTGQRIFYIDALHKAHGPVVRISPTEVAIADLEAFKEIHRVGSHYLKSAWYGKLANFLVLGVFTMIDPKDHSQRRKLLMRPFSRTQLLEHWDQTVKETAALCVKKIKEKALRGQADVFNWWMLLASDVSAHLAFGESFKMVEGGKETEFIRVLKKLTKGAGIMVEMPLLRILRYLPIKPVQETFNANDYIWREAARAVEFATSRTGEANIFRNVIEDSEKENTTLNDLDVRMEAINIIIAGTDTTGTTLTYLTWAVLQRPAVQRKLEEEVATLLYGAAPSSLPRVVPKGGAKFGPQDSYVPGGTTVCTKAYTFHRDPAIWENPLKFDPTRFLYPQTAEAKLAFHPFGAGARSCVGLHLARMELRYAAAMLFRECPGLRLSESTTEESMEFINFFLIAPKEHRCGVTLQGKGEAREGLRRRV
ncbi:cytochrome P450 monooxygenase-like protein [Mytilinidion resinicola]|uniref:Cytochrome P450 monooxygenase-like protein n=1 Tax=Mytilinidion resinicola TaxID=574789 RepID=A0A6A6Y5Q0_9PEZI|nr:cytochrome P450 monooxygenase-like protein [Mytilinidion resinicola]KAF2804136.1 cytochrome P450 monooxygenase-like protein [Mytilinidion resinicola]